MADAASQVDTIDRGDTTLSVTVRSGSPTVLLLHGLAGYGGEWGGVRHFLPDELGLIMPDQRGHGASFSAGESLDVTAERWVADAAACIEDHGARPVTVVGQSMGSLVAARLAAAHPELVANVVLIEGGMAAMTDDSMAGLAAWFDAWPAVFATRREATNFFGVDEKSTKAWVDGLQAVDGGFAPRFDAATMLETMRQLAGEDSWDLWKQLAMPTVVMRATSSALTDGEIGKMFELRPEAELVTVAGGHDLHLDEPEIVASVIARVALD